MTTTEVDLPQLLDEVRALHQPQQTGVTDNYGGLIVYCSQCRLQRWPCLTRRTLDKGTG